MSELIHLNETNLLEATIRFDSGEVCTISTGQFGLIISVRRNNSILGYFFKDILFKEKNIDNVVKIAMILHIDYIEDKNNLDISNPVLCAVSKAILNCDSTSQVRHILDEAKAHALLVDSVQLAATIGAYSSAKDYTHSKALETAPYEVIFSDDVIQINNLTKEELNTWAVKSNEHAKNNGLDYEITKILDKTGSVVWPVR